jgi:hypothetical protein
MAFSIAAVGLSHEFKGARLHGLNRGCHVTVPGNEDDWHIDPIEQALL